jgi:hypothetical protein
MTPARSSANELAETRPPKASAQSADKLAGNARPAGRDPYPLRPGPPMMPFVPPAIHWMSGLAPSWNRGFTSR